MKRRAKKQQKQQPPPAQRAKKSKKRSKGGAESLEERMQRLQGGHFRQINEMLYTSTGAAAAAAFRDDPALFGAYHAGYALQVAQWPEDPLDAVIAAVRAEGAKKRAAAEDRSSPLRVADLGCGVARMAAELDPARFAVHSFDLVAANERVTACNIAHVPLAAASVDAAAFCLSLMGTDHAAFVAEAHRILVPGGLLLVAEAKSRIGSVQVFVRGMELMGFERTAAAAAAADEDANTMFILFAFRKSRTRTPNVASAAPKLALKPCLYKRR